MTDLTETGQAENVPVLMSMGEHLDELRRYLIRIIIAVAAGFVIVFINKKFLFTHIILAPLDNSFFTNRFMCNLAAKINVPVLCLDTSQLELINIHLAGQFTAHIMVTLIASLIIVFPFILWQLWLFIKPALYSSERKKMRGIAAYASVLFFIGVFFSYFVIVPLALNFLGNYKVDESVENSITLMSYISTVSMITLAMGVVFQLPLIIAFLARTGIITAAFLKKNRKIVFIVLLVVSAIITPPDVFSQLLVVFPLYGLFELSIVISTMQERKRRPMAG